MRRPRDAAIWKLAGALKCRSSGTRSHQTKTPRPRRGEVRESDARSQTRRQVDYATIRSATRLHRPRSIPIHLVLRVRGALPKTYSAACCCNLSRSASLETGVSDGSRARARAGSFRGSTKTSGGQEQSDRTKGFLPPTTNHSGEYAHAAANCFCRPHGRSSDIGERNYLHPGGCEV